MPDIPRVHLIKPGSLVRDAEGNLIDARSSSSLIVSGERRIIVDTGLAGEEELILKGLERLGLRPDDIDTLVNTHTHLDHSGNNHLFSRARMMTPCEGDRIAVGVNVMETPGHSKDSVSLQICGHRRVVIAGDALPTFNNYIKMVPPAMHTDRETAILSMARIIAWADIVVPGHDRPFSIPDRKYITLE